MTRVLKPDELGNPDERMREKMRKLKLSPQEGEDTLTHLLLYSLYTVHFKCVYIASYPLHRDWRWTLEPEHYH